MTPEDIVRQMLDHAGKVPDHTTVTGERFSTSVKARNYLMVVPRRSGIPREMSHLALEPLVAELERRRAEGLEPRPVHINSITRNSAYVVALYNAVRT